MTKRINRILSVILSLMMVASIFLEASSAWADEFTLPSGLTRVEAQAFYGDRSLNEVVIPEGVEYIGPEAFVGTSLTDVTLPASITYIAENAFDESGKVKFHAPAGSYAYTWINNRRATIIDSGKCGNSVEWTLDSKGLLTISGTGAMFDYDKDETLLQSPWYEKYRHFITEVRINYGVTSIGACAFIGCESISKVTIPEGVESIQNYAFSWCTGLQNVHIPNGVKWIGQDAFSGSGLTSITIPDSLSAYGVGRYAFSNCSSLTSVILPDSHVSFGDNAFWYCTSLQTVVIPSGMGYIDSSWMFNGCSSLTSIALPEGFTGIYGYETFTECPNLKYMLIPDSVKYITDALFSKSYKPTIYCNAGSYAERYAQANKIPYTHEPWPFDMPVVPSASGSFGDPAYELSAGDKKSLAGTASVGKGFIERVTVQVSGYEPAEDYRYASVDLSGQELTSINLEDYSEFILDGTSAPFNKQGTYTIQMFVDESNGAHTLVDAAQVVVSKDAISGTIKSKDGKGIYGVSVKVMDDTQLCRYLITDINGQWNATGLTADKKYTIVYTLEGFSFDSNTVTATVGDELSCIAALVGVQNNAWTFEMTQNGEMVDTIVVGSAVHFAIHAEGSVLARLVVDNTPYNVVQMINGEGTLDRYLTSSGQRQVTFQLSMDGQTWSGYTDTKTLNVTGLNGELKAENLESPILHQLNDQIVEKGFDIEWEPVPYAETYTLYVFLNGSIIWCNYTDGNTLSMHIPDNTLNVRGEYTIVLMASAYGYQQSQGSMMVYVAPAIGDVDLKAPQTGILGQTISVYVDSRYNHIHTGIIITAPDGTLIETKRDGEKFSFVCSQPGTYHLKAYADFNENCAGENAAYVTESTMMVASAQNPTATYNNVAGRGIMFTDETINIAVSLNFVADRMVIRENETVLNSSGDLWLWRASVAGNMLSPGIHHLVVEAYYEQEVYTTEFTVFVLERMSKACVVNRSCTLRTWPDSTSGMELQQNNTVTLCGILDEATVYVQYGLNMGFLDASSLEELQAHDEKIEVVKCESQGISYSNIAEPDGEKSWFVPASGDLNITLMVPDSLSSEDINIACTYLNAGYEQRTIPSTVFTSITSDKTVKLTLPEMHFAYGIYDIVIDSNNMSVSAAHILVNAFPEQANRIMYVVQDDVKAYKKAPYFTNQIPLNLELGESLYVIGQFGNQLIARYDKNDVNEYYFVDSSSLSESKARRYFALIGSGSLTRSENEINIRAIKSCFKDYLVNTDDFECIIDQEYSAELDRAEGMVDYVLDHATENDEVYVYIHTHGFCNNETILKATGRADDYRPDLRKGCYFVMKNSTGYFMADFMRKISLLRAKKVVVIVDCCFSGACVDIAEQLELPQNRFSVLASTSWYSQSNAVQSWNRYDPDDFSIFSVKMGSLTYDLENYTNNWAPISKPTITVGDLRKHIKAQADTTTLTQVQVEIGSDLLWWRFGFREPPEYYGNDNFELWPAHGNFPG